MLQNWLSLHADCTQQLRQADESRNTDQLDGSYRCFDQLLQKSYYLYFTGHHNHSMCLILITIVMVLNEKELTHVICYRTKNKEANKNEKFFSFFIHFFILHIKNSLVNTQFFKYISTLMTLWISPTLTWGRDEVWVLSHY